MHLRDPRAALNLQKALNTTKRSHEIRRELRMWSSAVNDQQPETAFYHRVPFILLVAYLAVVGDSDPAAFCDRGDPNGIEGVLIELIIVTNNA